MSNESHWRSTVLSAVADVKIGPRFEDAMLGGRGEQNAGTGEVCCCVRRRGRSLIKIDFESLTRGGSTTMRMVSLFYLFPEVLSILMRL